MTPERFKKIVVLYHAALARPPEARASFLSDACGGDEELRQEVDSLISAHEQSSDFLSKPAVEDCLPLIADSAPQLAGCQFGPYKILSLIGAAGTGEVYVALDTRFGRRVAVKSLYPSLTAEADRARRCWHEAKAACAISHQNVAQVYDVVETEGHTLIVMEYVDGVTLRQVLAGGPQRPVDLLRTATQISAALTAAHEAGVVHRDIKPENVMLLADGHVKVLDFGLAKRVEPAAAGAGWQADMPSLLKTTRDVLVGTLPYMSPEQVRTLSTDARTDLWSLGVIIYELATGTAPFGGDTRSDIIAAILERTPVPLSERAPDSPPELQRIIDKALEKDTERRYATAREMHTDLEALRDEVLLAARNGQRKPPAPVPAPPPPTEPDVRPPVSVWRWLRRAWPMLLALLAAVGGLVAWASFPEPARHFLPGRFVMRNFSESGRVSDAAVGPDGRFVVYVTSEEDGKQRLWQKQVATADRIQLPQQVRGTYRGLAISPDANFIYYSLFRDAPQGELYRVSLPAATHTQRLLQDVDPPVTLSPDGRRLAFIRQNHDRPHELIIASADDGMPLKVIPESRLAPGGVAWSPRGDIIACSVRVQQGGRDYVSVAGFGATDTEPVTLTTRRWMSVDRIAWLGDMGGLVLIAADDESRLPQVWHLSYPDGAVRRITNDISEYRTLSVTRDSSTIVTTASMRSARVAVGAPGNAAPAIVSAGRDEGFYGVAWAPDGRIVYTSTASGSRSLWIMNKDGSGQRQLTREGRNDRYPAVSPDGRHVLFVSERDGTAKIWRVNIDGTEPVPLTGGPDDSFPTVSPDGRWVVYSSRVANRRALFKVPLGGGPPALLTQYLATWPAVSPNGRFIACLYRADRGTEPVKLAVIPFEGGEPLRLFDLPPGISQPPELISAGFHWSRDGRAILYANTADGASNIVSQPLDGGPKQLTNFHTERIFWFDPSRTDDSLVYARGQYTHDVILISDQGGAR